jgi:hypothetical protein
MSKKRNCFYFFIFLLWNLQVFALEFNFKNALSELKSSLVEFKLIKAREIFNEFQKIKLSREQWLQVRDLIHQYPQIGLDVLLRFDQRSPIELNNVDNYIKKSDSLMLDKKFREAAIGYQLVLKIITKNKKFKTGRNYQLYWTMIHSLARAFYGNKQFEDAFILYRTIPSSYPFYKQVQFELMWNNYMNDRLEYSLGAIATMASGHFSKMLDPEVYLLQYYIYRRMCRDEEVELIKKRVRIYHEALTKFKFPLGNWIKSDVETLVYKQILESGDHKSREELRLRAALESRKNADVLRLQGEFDLVLAHLDLDNGKNKNLKPVKSLLSVDELLAKKNEKWTVEDNEIWVDELGKQVFIQRDLCGKEPTK